MSKQKKKLAPSKSTHSLDVSQASPNKGTKNNRKNTFEFNENREKNKIIQAVSKYEAEVDIQQGSNKSQNNNQKCNGIGYKDQEYSNDYNAYEKQRDNQTVQSQFRQHLQKQFKMRMDSVVKGYQLKLSRQQETFELKEMKYNQQIQYLKRQLKELSTIKKQSANPAHVQQHCSICSNGEILRFMKNMLEAVQSDHKGCLTQKHKLNTEIVTIEQKLKYLEIENEEKQERYQKCLKQNKQMKNDKQLWERQKREKQKQYRQLERNFHTKQLHLEQQVAKQKILHKELQAQIDKIKISHLQSISKSTISSRIHPHNIDKSINDTIVVENPKIIRPNLHRDGKTSNKNTIEHRQNPQVGPNGSKNKNYSMYEQIQQQNQPYDQHNIPKRYSQTLDYRQYLEQSRGNYPEAQYMKSIQPSMKANINANNCIGESIKRKFKSIDKSHIAPTWKTKMEESYADYANSLRGTKTKKLQSKSPLYSNSYINSNQNFETFRPSLGYGMKGSILGRERQRVRQKQNKGGSIGLKYNYLD